jgi:hypothetical protein
MEVLSRFLINALAAVKDAKERVVMVLRVVPLVKERGEWYKCSKWVPVCTSRYRKTVIHAKGRDRLFLKVENAKSAWARR